MKTDKTNIFQTTVVLCVTALWPTLTTPLGCGDGNLHVTTGQHDMDVRDTTIEVEETDADVGTETGEIDTKDAMDSATDGEADLPVHFTVKMQAENYDAFDFKGNERQWITVTTDSPADQVDPSDALLAETAHGDAFLMALPNLGSWVMADPEQSPQVSYDVQLEIPGRYYVWGRAWTTAGDDNGIHVGLNGAWPQSGRNIQFPYTSNAWIWSSNQRDSGGEPYGVPRTIYLDVDAPGVHRVTFAMREDGFRFDEWVLTTDETRVP